MKKHRRIIEGVICFVIISVVTFLGFNVFAAKTTDGAKCKGEAAMYDRYQPKASLKNGQLVLTVKTGAFKIDKVESGENLFSTNPLSLGTLTSTNPLYMNVKNNVSGKIKINLILVETDSVCLSKADSDNEGTGTYSFSLVLDLPNLSTTVHYKKNTNYDKICKVLMNGTGYDTYKDYLKNITAEDVANYNYQVVDRTGKGHYDSLVNYCQQPNVNLNYTVAQTGSMISSAISSWKKLSIANIPGDAPAVGFNEAFNFAKEQALQIPGHHYENYDGKSEIGDSLTCDWKKEATGNKGDAYYVNKDYYYAKNTEDSSVSYVYNYTSGSKKTETKENACTRTCEESVVVEYGPPVASKAGLCFEYKVKVTSRVKCVSDIKVQPPTPPTVCTPVPVCNQIPGMTHQGGPSEDFDACIRKCDGGKYSQKCSNKCYKEVYGKKSTSKLGLNYSNSVARPMAGEGLFAGKYEMRGGNISWSNANTYGRWYEEQEYARTLADHGTYSPVHGFKRQNFGGGNFCSDNCSWSGCGADSYLNGEEAARDYVQNLTNYNNSIATCRASASCTTKTANFSINVTYYHAKDENEDTDTTIYFPYTKNNAKNVATLPSLGSVDGKPNNAEADKTEIFIPDTNPKGYNGCYDRASAKNWYQAEWSFPGTWIHNKTGEISYVDQSKSSAWHNEKNKFCVPLNALSVNTKWWEWSQVKKDCLSESAITDSIVNNIEAETTEFGYFGWDFKFNCFYALRNEVCDTNTNGCCNPPPSGDDEDGGTNGPKNFSFRIVDTMNLFPATDGTSPSLEEGDTVTGRLPGFNWTSEASIKEFKNKSYKVDPTTLIGKIQKRQNGIYDSAKEAEYLDYSFVLDIKTLAAIRKYNLDNSKKYTDYEGTTIVKNGITIYESKFINQYASIQGNVGCNNDGIGASCELNGGE